MKNGDNTIKISFFLQQNRLIRKNVFQIPCFVFFLKTFGPFWKTVASKKFPSIKKHSFSSAIYYDIIELSNHRLKKELIMNNIVIRQAVYSDIDRIYELERMTFPPAEAASMEKFDYRLRKYPDFFLVAETDGIVQSYLTCIPVNVGYIDDGMYEAEPFPEGDTLAILAVGTNPEFQRRGIAGALIREGLNRAVKLGMHHAVLACKEEKFHFYSNLGFHEVGRSKSEHGNAIWYDMAMELKKEGK